MGNLFDACTKQQSNLEDDSERLIKNDASSKLRASSNTTERGAKYYQLIIDEAHRNFISASNRHRTTNGAGNEELRSQILSANISLEQSPSFVIPIGNKKSSRSQNIVEILSDATATDFSSIEVAADEIAECIQNVMQMNPVNVRSGEGASGDASGSGSLVFGSSVVVSFKPVTTGSIASGN